MNVVMAMLKRNVINMFFNNLLKKKPFGSCLGTLLVGRNQL
jgi:hypothetical protein